MKEKELMHIALGHINICRGRGLSDLLYVSGKVTCFYNYDQKNNQSSSKVEVAVLLAIGHKYDLGSDPHFDPRNHLLRC